MDEEFSAMQLKALILFLILGATVFVYFRLLKPPKSVDDWKTELASTKVSTKNSDDDDSSLNVKDVWSERRKRGVTASSSSSKQAAGDKPFGSSYYYAHNNPNTTGGYKDGLRMEDYTMNQPRLLSKGGVPAEQQQQQSEASVVDDSTASAKTTSNTNNKRVSATPARRISKFLWDDPGDPNGIATIRIDTLPGPTLTETISWREANIVDVAISLPDEKRCLLIELEGADGVRYRLQIPKLYGEVDEVRKVAKPNRLLIRVFKKKSWMNPFDKKNLQAWPHP